MTYTEFILFFFNFSNEYADYHCLTEGGCECYEFNPYPMCTCPLAAGVFPGHQSSTVSKPL